MKTFSGLSMTMMTVERLTSSRNTTDPRYPELHSSQYESFLRLFRCPVCMWVLYLTVGLEWGNGNQSN